MDVCIHIPIVLVYVYIKNVRGTIYLHRSTFNISIVEITDINYCYITDISVNGINKILVLH